MTNWTESEDVLIFQTCGIFGILSSRFLKAVPLTPCSRLRLGFLPKVKQSVVVMMPATWELNTDVRGNFLVRIKMPQLFKTKKVCEAWENTALLKKINLFLPETTGHQE